MKEKEIGKRFSYDIDNLLRADLQDSMEVDNTTTKAYQESYDLARRLIELDLSDESSIRRSLKNKLLDRITSGEQALGCERGRRVHPGRFFFLRRHPGFAVAFVLMISIFVVINVWPGSLTTAAQFIENIVRSLFVGENTSIHQVSPINSTREKKRVQERVSVEKMDNLWIINTPVGGFAATGLPGEEIIVHRYRNFKEAIEDVYFNIRKPEYLPPGYILSEVILTSGGQAFLIYDGSPDHIILHQCRVGKQPAVEEGYEYAGEVQYIGIAVLTNESIVSVELNYESAGWIDNYGLIWERDGISYFVGGTELDLEDAKRIAESIQIYHED